MLFRSTAMLRFDPEQMHAWMEAGARKAAEVIVASPFAVDEPADMPAQESAEPELAIA